MHFIDCKAFDWQYPAITEKFAYDQIKANNYLTSLDGYYLAYPWATIVDTFHKQRSSKAYHKSLQHFLNEHQLIGKIRHSLVFTVCQTVYFRDFLVIFKQLGINLVFTPHAIQREYAIYLKKYGIEVLPFPLYPVNTIEPAPKKDLLYSFIGCTTYTSRNLQNAAERATKTRTALVQAAHPFNTVIESLDEWHFYGEVYRKQIYGNERTEKALEAQEKREDRFKKVLAQSRFSICPGGMGPSSIRFWESLQAGAIPVNISDDFWLPSGDIHWSDCCISIAEKDINGLSTIIETTPKAQEALLRKNTLAAYVAFTEQGFIHTLVKAIKDRGNTRRKYIFLIQMDKLRTYTNQQFIPYSQRIKNLITKSTMLKRYSFFDKGLLFLLSLVCMIGIISILNSTPYVPLACMVLFSWLAVAYIIMVLRTNQRSLGTLSDTFAKKQMVALSTTKKAINIPSVYDRLRHAEKIGLSPKVVVDGGANKGNWTKGVSCIFPDATFICVEPNSTLNRELKRTISESTNQYKIINVALGKNLTQGKLNIWSDSDSASLLDHIDGPPKTVIETDIITIDELCKRHNMQPDLIKLDLQGGELDALIGASTALKTCEMIVTEFGCLDAYLGRTSNKDLFNLMYANDYCLYDIVDMHYRPYDGALTGGDFIFVKNSSVLRKYQGYK